MESKAIKFVNELYPDFCSITIN